MTFGKGIIKRLQSSDKEAFRIVFDEYARKVYYFALGHVKNKADAEEIVQEAFTRLWEKRTTLDEEQSLNGFLFTMSYRLVVDYFRRKKVLLQKREQLFQLLTDEDYQTEEQFFYQELESLYLQAIQQLPPRRKEIFVLSRQQGLTHQEIAGKLQISPKTVEHQVSHALHFLREYFKQHTLTLSFLVWLGI